MSYGKKDEDADQAIVKVDRTSVFQEGMCQVVSSHRVPTNGTLQRDYSIPPPYRLEDVVSS